MPRLLEGELEGQKAAKHEAKAFLLSSIVLSAAVFNIAFWYGVSGTIFFEHLLHVWIVATVALAACAVLPRITGFTSFTAWRGRFVLALPSLWFALEVTIRSPDVLAPWQQWLLWALAAAILALTLPYVVYVLVVITVPDIEHLHSPLLCGAVLLLSLASACAGLTIGHHHPSVLTCRDFEIAGDYVPPNCSPVSSKSTSPVGGNASEMH